MITIETEKMKNKNLQLVLLLIGLNVTYLSAQTQIFLETMGTVSGTTTLSAHESAGGFDNDSYTMTDGGATNPVDIRTTSNSTGYTGASGGANVWFTSTAGDRGFAIEGIDASLYSNLLLSFAVRKEGGSGSAFATLDVSYWDGSSYQSVTVSGLPQTSSAVGWYYISDVSLPAAAQINGLRIRFVKSGTIGGRVDDIKLTGTTGGGATPTITPSLSSISFGTVSSIPTSSQTFTVSGTNLSANITVTPPTGFEISQNGGSWQTAAITLTQSSGTVSSTTIYVRYNPSGTGTHNGNISLTSTDATTQNVSVSGTYSVSTGSIDYSSAYKLYGTALRQALHDLITNHTSVSYASLWTHFQTTDVKSNGKVWDIYSDIPNGTPPYEFTFVSHQCGTYNSEADCYNREHSWPASWLSDQAPAYSDLFHLYPTDGYVNNIRSNYNYGTVGTATFTSQNGSKLGNNTYPGYSGTVFEPINEYKGDLARSAFYMSTRYYTEDAAWSTSGGTNKSDLLSWYSNLFYDWSLIDQVSTKEINRNNAIEAIQHNRNPFIDHPEYVAEIWKTTMAPAVVSVASTAQTIVVIDFSRYVDSASACTMTNFIFSGGVGNPQSVEWGVNSDVSKVRLRVNGLAEGNSYTIQVKNIKSINNVAMNDTTISLGSVLPVELISFNASAKNNLVLLTWKTATEVNNNGFEIEKRREQKSEIRNQIEGKSWQKIGFVEGSGTSNTPKEYQFVDNGVSAGQYRYRLKQIDRDGRFEYSSVVEANVIAPEQYSLSQNYPNPFNPTTTIRYSLGLPGFVSLKVFDLLGKEIAVLVNEFHTAGDFQATFNAEKIPSGLYFYTLTAGTFSASKKLLLLK